jgi:large subunit ribosomal protein L25
MLPQGVTLLSDPEEVAATITAPTEITEEDMEAAGIVEEPTDEEEATAAEGEEATGEDGPEEGEGPAGQNVQA